MVDYLNFNVARVLLYERQGVVSTALPGLGSNMFAVTRPEALAIGRKSDFVIIYRPAAPLEALFPFEQCMQRITPNLTTFCKRNYTALETFHLSDGDLTLYVRPAMKIEGDSAGWITSRGLSLRGTGAFLHRHTKIKLAGRTEFELLDVFPSVIALLRIPGRSPLPVEARFTTHGEDYVIELELQNVHVAAQTPVEIRLAFNSYFVPQKKGLGDDRRHLVIRTPVKTELLYH
jgi:hypothetical protein